MTADDVTKRMEKLLDELETRGPDYDFTGDSALDHLTPEEIGVLSKLMSQRLSKAAGKPIHFGPSGQA